MQNEMISVEKKVLDEILAKLDSIQKQLDEIEEAVCRNSGELETISFNLK